MTDSALGSGPTTRDFSLGRVLHGTAVVVRRRFLPLMGLSLIPGLGWLLAPLFESHSAVQAGGWRRYALLIILVLIAMVLSAPFDGALIHAAYQDVRNQPMRLRDSIRIGLARFLPLIGTLLACAFATALGTILLIVPGIIVFCMTFVASCACVIERTGPSVSFSRSGDLTRGHRWKIFVIMLLIAAVGTGISYIPNIIPGLPGQIVSFLVDRLLWIVQSVVAVVAYHDLRVAREGVDIAPIVAVFD